VAQPAPVPGIDKAQLVADVKAALYASKVCSYAQGMAIIKAKSDEKGWGVNMGGLARIWKVGHTQTPAADAADAADADAVHTRGPPGQRAFTQHHQHPNPPSLAPPLPPQPLTTNTTTTRRAAASSAPASWTASARPTSAAPTCPTS
jgi:hypothetical protein